MKLPNFSAARVLIVGDAMIDKYWKGSVLRISPEAPVPVVRVEDHETCIGGAGNVAVNAVTYGAKTYLLSLAGADAEADHLEQLLNAKKVQFKLQRVTGSKTIVKLRVLSQHQQLLRLDFENQFLDWDTNLLQSDFASLLPKVDVVILSDYAKGILREPARLIKAAIAAGKPVIADPKGIDFSRYTGATCITPNFAEFQAVVGNCSSEAEIEDRGIALRDMLKLDSILITRSEKGMTLLARDHAPLHIPARKQDVFDVTGAGDTVVATLGVAIASGISLTDSVILANVAAGVAVSKLGTVSVSYDELNSAIHNNPIIYTDSILDEAHLQVNIAAARIKGERIVMTNGCFDILHPGHIAYLEKARALGDKLIVAVNDDASVERLKGANRPVNSLANRLRMLAALKCVDWVVSFCEDTPKRIYCQLLPDVLVKGGDYTEAQVVGGDCVKAAGGRVEIISLLEGYSTTNLISSIRSSLT